MRSDLLRLLSHARPYRRDLAIAFLSLIAAGALGLTFPQLVRLIIDAAFAEHNLSKLNGAALLLIGIFACQALFSFLRSYLISYTGERIVADMRAELYAHLMRMSLSFFDGRRVGELTSRLASDVSIIQAVTAGSLAELLRLALMLVGGIAIIAVTNPGLTLLMLSVVPVVVISAHLYGRRVRRLSAQVQDRLAEANTVLEETLSGIRMVQSFAREEYERRRYGQKLQEALRVAAKSSAASGGFIAFIILVVYSGIVVVLWFGSRMVVAGKMTAGQLIAFLLYTFVVSAAVGGISELYGQFQRAIGATRRIFEILDTEPDIKDPQEALPLAGVRGSVSIRNVSFAYPGSNLPVLREVNLEVSPGEVIALVGPSGAGKSTLVSLIPRFYDVTSGAILIDGHDIRAVKLEDLRRAIGIVPQEMVLFGGTIRENIAYGKLDATYDEIEAAARAAHAHEFICEFPNKYETVVGERGVKLSGGQRQRIAIARAILKDPAILILDEATSSLDSESERLVQEALEALMRGRTTFVIAHRLSTVRRADRIVVVHCGRVIEEGAHEELLARGGLYRQLYDLQFRDWSLLPS